ncbi:hypothetical protein O181_128258 [Austropuccinia psidii MF-1]|uniref:Reverse transcriptase Ty1/copia-type domain-containing protein n=1 Tax=Austropuccinia psidii MF-1 TaxID=1389203 RepID=A0A9Q3Q7Q1_9BASI|nr:hypothetical protein [Austropuccinia psidii MF-1]
MKVTNLINKIGLQLGKEQTEEICEEQDRQIDEIQISSDMEIPANLKEAKQRNWEQWRDAINREFTSFDEMDVWMPVKKTRDMRVIKTTFVFDLKRKGQPEQLTYKARLVARGFCQRHGIDCEHTYAPTALLTSLQFLLALGLKNNWKIASFYVAVAYLHSPLEENIYVKAPIEFRPEWLGKVMKLKKAMYGLKQAGRCWWLYFRSVMEKIGFCAEELDQCIYKCTRNNTILFVWMHVDDGVIFSNDQEEIMKLKHQLIQNLKIKWEDGLSRIVGINITFKHNAIQLSQLRFIELSSIGDKTGHQFRSKLFSQVF